MRTEVAVVVKAANGAVSDFRVTGAERRWTVAELKNYLYRHYPTHPVCVYLLCVCVSAYVCGEVSVVCIRTKPRKKR